VLEAIGDLDEWFQCSDCNGDVTPEDIKAAGDDLPRCADCRGDEEGDEDEDEEGDSK
jgi:NAD-dependent SIR2 family protein deacetylase